MRTMARPAHALHRGEDRHQRVGLDRVHAGGRLVEEEERRPHDERAGDLEPPPLAVGQGAGEAGLAPFELETDELAPCGLLRAAPRSARPARPRS